MMDSVIAPQRFVFLDRDGIINVERGDYTVSIDQWEWAEGALEGLKKLTDAGFGIIVITNQGCIAKGLQTIEGLTKLHRYMLDRINETGGNILGIYYCPHETADGCSCHKPEPGLLLKAAKHFAIPLHETFMVGDSLRDMEAGRRAGTRTILVGPGPGSDSPRTQFEPGEFRVATLLEAVDIVIRETPKRDKA